MVYPSLYRNYVIYYGKGLPLLYVNMNKALYGLLKSVLLFYNKLRGELESIGFEINPYYPYISNKRINRTHIKMSWYVDDLKLSHKYVSEITKFGM